MRGGQNWQDDNGGNGDLQAETVVGLAVDYQSGTTLVAAGQDGTVYISTNAGQSWTEAQVGTTSSLSTVAADPGDASTLLVGTQTDGIYLSTNAGYEWQPTTGIPADSAVHAIAVDPHNAAVVYAATDAGIYQSIDGGNTWLAEQSSIPADIPMDW